MIYMYIRTVGSSGVNKPLLASVPTVTIIVDNNNNIIQTIPSIIVPTNTIAIDVKKCNNTIKNVITNIMDEHITV